MSSRGLFRIAWLTNVPSGDQIDLLRALAVRPDVELTVIYCCARSTKGSIEPEEPDGRGLVLGGVTFPGTGGTIFLNPSIITHLWKNRYDLIIVAGYAQPTMQLAMLVRFLQRKPWVLFGERPGMNRKSRLIKLLRTFPLLMLETADAIVGTGRLAQQEYGRGLGFKRPIFSMPYLVDLDAFLQIERPKVRASNGVAFLACGDLIPRKGMDVLLSAFTRAARSSPNISLSIVGDGPERAALIKRVPKELTHRVRFTGRIPFADRGQPFASADVFVHSARHDGWGVVIQEALSAGLPVIATRETGAAHDLIEDGENGFLVDAEDEDGLCERMVWFAQNQDEINALGARARKSASRLTPEWGAGEIVAIVRNVLGMRGPKHL